MNNEQPPKPVQETTERATLETDNAQGKLEDILSKKPLPLENTKAAVSEFLLEWEPIYFKLCREFAEDLDEELFFHKEKDLATRLAERLSEEYGASGLETFFEATCDLFPDHNTLITNIWGDGALFEAVGFDLFIDKMVELVATKDSRALTHLVEGLLYSFSVFHESKSYREAIKRHLDINNPDSWPRTTKFLEALRLLLIESFENQDEQAAAIIDALREIDKRDDGNYILHLRIKQLLESEVDEVPADEAHMREDDLLPFEMGKGVFGFHFGESLYISDEKDYAQIQELVANASRAMATIDAHDLFALEKKSAEAMLALWPFFKKQLSLEDVQTQNASDDHDRVVADMIDYKYLLIKPVREHIKEDLGVDITALSIPEQFHFLSFLKTVSTEDIRAVRRFTKTYSTPGLRTFLALEHEKGFGPSIIALGEKLSEDGAHALFKKYGELLDAATEAESYVEHAFGKKGDKKLVGAISKNLLEKATELLRESSQNLDDAPDVKSAEGEIAERLEMIEGATELFLSTFKTLAKSGESISLAEIRELSFEHVHPTDLSPDDMTTMRTIYAQNYQATPELQHELLAHFDAATNAEQPPTPDKPLTFYTLRHNNRIVAFCAFTEYEHGKIRFSMMNIDPHYQNSALGQTFLDRTLAIESPFGKIDAACDAYGPAARHYIEKGFVGKRSFTYHEVQAIDISFLDTTIARTWPLEKILERASSTEHADGDGVLVATAPTPQELPFDLLNKGKILSRYFKKDDHYYAVFENPIPKDTSAIIV